MSGGGLPAAGVLVAGLVPPGPSGMRDYGQLVAQELRRRGIAAQEWWLENDGVTFGPALAASLRLLRQGAGVRAGTVVVWNYSPFAYAFRGVPLPGILLGLVLRSRRATVVTVFHEIAYPWGRRGLAGRIFALTQRAAVVPVVAGSNGFLVTTEERATFVRRWARFHPPDAIRVAPVFSTVGQGPPPSAEAAGVERVGVIGYGADGAQPDLLFGALRHLDSFEDVQVVLLGAPGPDSAEGQAWVRAAERAGVAHAVEFSGVLSVADLSERIAACGLIALVDEEGPTARRTMLAAALAHGRPVVATDGPNRWDAPVREGAIAVAPPEATALGATIQRLAGDPEERAAMSALAFKFYEREMSLTKACDSLCGLLSDLGRAPSGPTVT